MLTYWILFLVPALLAVGFASRPVRPWRYSVEWWLVWLALTLLIGYRYEVGGDWLNYMRSYDLWSDLPLSFVFESGEPGYFFLNWIAARTGLGICGVNLLCGALFSMGLVAFAREQPNPWLALVVSIPYLVIVVAMGYSRQGVAVGLTMLGLVALGRGRNLGFVAWVVVGALVHKSAIILLPLAIMVSKRGRWWTAIWVTGTTAVAFDLLLESHTDAWVTNYIETSYNSEGALIRVLMNGLAAALFLLARKRFQLDDNARRLWTWMAAISVVTLGLLVISPSSTAVDRMALYFIPLQIFVFARLPSLRMLSFDARNTLRASVVLYYALVQMVWLFFAVHAAWWLPYRFYPLERLLRPGL